MEMPVTSQRLQTYHASRVPTDYQPFMSRISFCSGLSPPALQLLSLPNSKLRLCQEAFLQTWPQSAKVWSSGSSKHQCLARSTRTRTQSSLLLLMPTASRAKTCWQLLLRVLYPDCNTCNTAASSVPAQVKTTSFKTSHVLINTTPEFCRRQTKLVDNIRMQKT